MFLVVTRMGCIRSMSNVDSLIEQLETMWRAIQLDYDFDDLMREVISHMKQAEDERVYRENIRQLTIAEIQTANNTILILTATITQLTENLFELAKGRK